MKAPFAPPGTRLAGDADIQVSEVGGHKSEGSLDGLPCGDGECPTPDACGMGACGMDGGFGGDDDF